MDFLKRYTHTRPVTGFVSRLTGSVSVAVSMSGKGTSEVEGGSMELQAAPGERVTGASALQGTLLALICISGRAMRGQKRDGAGLAAGGSIPSEI